MLKRLLPFLALALLSCAPHHRYDIFPGCRACTRQDARKGVRGWYDAKRCPDYPHGGYYVSWGKWVRKCVYPDATGYWDVMREAR